jgi:hypothetical protein
MSVYAYMKTPLAQTSGRTSSKARRVVRQSRGFAIHPPDDRSGSESDARCRIPDPITDPFKYMPERQSLGRTSHEDIDRGRSD